MEENNHLKQFLIMFRDISSLQPPQQQQEPPPPQSESHESFVLPTLQTISEEQKKQIQFILNNTPATAKQSKKLMKKQMKMKKDPLKPKRPITAYFRFIKDVYKKMDV